MSNLISREEALAKVREYVYPGLSGEELQRQEPGLSVSDDAVESESGSFIVVGYGRSGELPPAGGFVFYVDQVDGAVFPVSGSMPPRLQLEAAEKQRKELRDGQHLATPERVHPTGARGSLTSSLPVGLTKDALVAYLRSCPVVLSARTRVPDRIDPTAKPIPLAYYSDGPFVWSGETAAYVDRYELGLPAEFLTHVAAQGAQPPELSDEQRHAATESVSSDSANDS